MLKIDEHYLDEDLEDAYLEWNCVLDSLMLLQFSVQKEDYKKAVFHTENLIRSLKELERLNNKKKNQQKLNELMSELNSDKVKIIYLRMRK